MKHLLLTLLIPFLSLTSVAAHAQSINLNGQPLAVQLAVAALKGCLAEQIGESRMRGLERKVNEAVKRIEGYCRNKNEKHAFQAVAYYAKEPEAKAAITCARQLKPVLDQPSLQPYLQKHRRDIDTVLAGKIPSPICR